MYKIYTQSGIIETESYQEVLIHQKQGCTVLTDVDLREIDQAREYRVIGEAFLVEPEKIEK